MSDLELLRSGDTKFIETIYSGCYRSISSWIRKNSGTEIEAEDVFQDAMVAVYQKAANQDFVLNCKLTTFIFGVARNIWLDRLRSRKHHLHKNYDASSLEEIPESDEHILNEIVNDVEVDLVYRRNFKKLTDECQKILVYFFNGFSMKEIVKKMKFSNDGIARKKKFSCKNELVKLVESDPYYPELVEKRE